METLLLTEKDINKAAEIIKSGGLVAMPTETVYGLAADALNGKAVEKIFKAKGRPMDNPLIVHIAALEQIKALVTDFPEKAQALAKAFWPGPLTMVLPRSDIIPPEVSAGLDTVAVRYPVHPLAQALIMASKTPIAAPSANTSGKPSPTTAEHVMKDLSGKIDAVLDGGSCDVGLESTVITLCTDVPRLLRPGGITLSQLESVIGRVDVDEAVLNRLAEGKKAASPGMKYKHYSPAARVVMIKGASDNYTCFVNAHKADNMAALCFDEDIKRLEVPYISLGARDDYRAQAHNLFDALREADKVGYGLVLAHAPDTKGVGLAVYNRLIRAAGFEVKTLEN